MHELKALCQWDIWTTLQQEILEYLNCEISCEDLMLALDRGNVKFLLFLK